MSNNAILEMTPTEVAAYRLECIERCLTANSGINAAKEFSSYLHWMFRNGGPDNLAEWCLKKLINRKDDLEEAKRWRIELFLKRYKTWATADAVVQVQELERQDAINAAKRADNMNAIQQRAISERSAAEHPHAAIKRRLEESLLLNAAPKAEAPSIAPPKGHCRRAKGECGQRIGEKIDAILWVLAHYEPEDQWPDAEPLGLDELLLEIQTKPSDPLAPPVVITASAAPPSPQGAGVQSADASAAAGGCSGFTNDLSTVWDAFSGMEDCANDISDFLIEIDENPRLRSSANLRTLGRVRDELEKIPENASLRDPVVIQLQDVLLLMNQLMSRMR